LVGATGTAGAMGTAVAFAPLTDGVVGDTQGECGPACADDVGIDRGRAVALPEWARRRRLVVTFPPDQMSN
jgi:hypothetical protein